MKYDVRKVDEEIIKVININYIRNEVESDN